MGRSSRAGSSRSRSPERDCDDREHRRQRKLEEKRRRKLEERRAKETPEERLARKQRKKGSKVTIEQFGYSNEANPFGDVNLTGQFVWKKKAEKEGTAPLSKRKQQELVQQKIEEIEKVRKRRKDAETEAEEMERLRAEESRMQEQAQYGEWKSKEEAFHLQQARIRSKIRLIEGRDKPIDRMAKNILLFGSDNANEAPLAGVKYSGGDGLDLTSLEMEVREPYTLCEGLSEGELEELLEDIRSYQNLTRAEDGGDLPFWVALGVVTGAKLAELRSAGDASGLHKSVRDDVANLVAGKTEDELERLKKSVEGYVDRGEGDADYWTAVLMQVRAQQSRLVLRSMHQGMLERQLDRLEKMGGAAKLEQARRAAQMVLKPSTVAAAAGSNAAEVVDDSAAARALARAAADQGLEENEDAMGGADEVSTAGTVYQWEEKYRPRKPRYFNRVKTGYDWNKYNQTHYDHDNPPPKTVQGYKFNIFYPDLIDKTITPNYRLERADRPEFCIIRFTAGPPYQDLCFKIVNREWERGRKKGFKSVFDRGVLTLHFNFVRPRYRK